MLTDHAAVAAATGYRPEDVALYGATHCRRNPRGFASDLNQDPDLAADGLRESGDGSAAGGDLRSGRGAGLDTLDQRTAEDCEWVPAFLADIDLRVDLPDLSDYRPTPRARPDDWIFRCLSHEGALQATIGDEDLEADEAQLAVARGERVDFIRIAGDRRERVVLRLARGDDGEATFVPAEAMTAQEARTHTIRPDGFHHRTRAREDEAEALIDESRMARIGRTAAHDPGAVNERLARARREAESRQKRDVAIYLRQSPVDEDPAWQGGSLVREAMIDDVVVFEIPAMTADEAAVLEPAYRAALQTFAAELHRTLADRFEPAKAA